MNEVAVEPITADDADLAAHLEAGDLPALMLAFTDPGSVVGAWTHYLIFDLFVGAWMVRDARREDIHHLAIVVPLLLTLMMGPVGLLLYIALKGVMKQKFSLSEQDMPVKAAA